MTGTVMVTPHSRESEESVLGALLLKPDALHEIADILIPEAFYLPKYRYVYEAICDRVHAGLPVDPVLLGDELEAAGASGIVTMADLAELANATPSAANIRAYADVVVDRFVRRQVMAASAEIHMLANQSGTGTDAVAESAKVIGEIRLSQSGGLVSARQTMVEVFADLCHRYDAKEAVSGLTTGFPALDDLLGGLHEDELIILAARPSMGKTALALNMAEAACSAGKAVAVFSLEMNRKQLGLRLISAVGGVNSNGLRTPSSMREADWPLVTNAQAIIQGWDLELDDSAELTLPVMRARCLRMHAKRKLGLVVIDYLQLMEGASGENRANAVAEISRGLKKLAKELKCPVIALSQLNRSLEQRADKRPMMSDLRESGAIEQDADVIAFIYRDEYYNRHSPDRGTAEIIVAKQRNGATDTVRLKTELHYSRFKPLEADWMPEDAPKKASLLPSKFRVDVPA